MGLKERRTPLPHKQAPALQKHIPLSHDPAPLLQKHIPILQQHTPDLRNHFPLLQENSPTIQSFVYCRRIPVLEKRVPVLREPMLVLYCKTTRLHCGSMFIYNKAKWLRHWRLHSRICFGGEVNLYGEIRFLLTRNVTKSKEDDK